MSVDFLVEIAKLAANSLTTGVVELFFGALLGSLFEFPCPSRAVYPFLLPTSAHVAGCQSVCL